MTGAAAAVVLTAVVMGVFLGSVKCEHVKRVGQSAQIFEVNPLFQSSQLASATPFFGLVWFVLLVVFCFVFFFVCLFVCFLLLLLLFFVFVFWFGFVVLSLRIYIACGFEKEVSLENLCILFCFVSLKSVLFHLLCV